MCPNRKKRNNDLFQLGFLGLLLFGLGWGVYLFSEWKEEAKLLPLQFENPDGKKTNIFHLEIVSTDAERAKGLMYRRELPSDRGMIFIYPSEKVESFWMKNTYVPLDMIFVSKDSVVVGILENVPILNEELRSVGKPALYVIELSAGSSRREGIQVGSRMLPGQVLPLGMD